MKYLYFMPVYSSLELDAQASLPPIFTILSQPPETSPLGSTWLNMAEMAEHGIHSRLTLRSSPILLVLFSQLSKLLPTTIPYFSHHSTQRRLIFLCSDTLLAPSTPYLIPYFKSLKPYLFSNIYSKWPKPRRQRVNSRTRSPMRT
jgi:hypothetical protein